MLIPQLQFPETVQIDDMVRLLAIESIANGGDEITKVEVKVDDGAYVDVTGNTDEDRFLDCVFDSAGVKTITVRLNETQEKSKALTVLSKEDDRLFSSDADIEGLEGEIRTYLKRGFSSFNHKHREAQKKIVEELNSRGFRDSDGEEITKVNVAITKELNNWSKYLTLSLIYFDGTTAIDSMQERKARHYSSLAENASRSRQFYTIDSDGSGPDEADKQDYAFSTATMVRR